MPFRRLIKNLTRIGERVSRAVARAGVGVTDSADCRLCAFEKLLTMTTQTGGMTRIVGHVLEGLLTLADLIPICGWKLVAGVASHLMRRHLMRESRVIRRLPRFATRNRAAVCRRAPLRFGCGVTRCRTRMQKYQRRQHNRHEYCELNCPIVH